MRHVRHYLRLVPLLIVFAACQVADQPVAGSTDDIGAIPEYSIEQFLASTNVFGSSFSPTGDKILVSSDETGIFNASSLRWLEILSHQMAVAIHNARLYAQARSHLEQVSEANRQLEHLDSRWQIRSSCAPRSRPRSRRSSVRRWRRTSRGASRAARRWPRQSP